MALSNEEKILALREIKELDVDAGLKIISNLVGAYLRVLGLLVKMNANDKGKLAEFLANGDVEMFRTTVHGYKSALANIGALGLSEQAKALEFAAKGGDRAFIDANVAAFEDGVTALSEKLKPILEIEQ